MQFQNELVFFDVECKKCSVKCSLCYTYIDTNEIKGNANKAESSRRDKIEVIA